MHNQSLNSWKQIVPDFDKQSLNVLRENIWVFLVVLFLPSFHQQSLTDGGLWRGWNLESRIGILACQLILAGESKDQVHTYMQLVIKLHCIFKW